LEIRLINAPKTTPDASLSARGQTGITLILNNKHCGD